MPIDLNIKHLIRFLKQFFAAKGIYSTWDSLGDISAIVDLLLYVHKQVTSALGVPYHGITHITPETATGIKKIAQKVEELQLLHFNLMWKESKAINPGIDTLTFGEQ
ncbi:hypothetical protein EV363DRAFT_1178760 [Boletus edulis]|uniref:DUF6589 domain-containing protein n=1 Tax=Boletus edulis BED1 TaxID=1328754 RepID=A0AAD4BJS4_BOLED|nr:hypothetical protein EV363DRAFT_1178760 [Boletus edulis]KAF8432014.1 hypothetical protein L210DRAFT_3414787 [Boletus edulis BED1]